MDKVTFLLVTDTTVRNTGLSGELSGTGIIHLFSSIFNYFKFWHTKTKVRNVQYYA